MSNTTLEPLSPRRGCVQHDCADCQNRADVLTAQAATIAEQAAQIEALRADAERYRWLRKGGGLWGICVWDDDEWIRDARTNVDAAIKEKK